MKYKMNLISKTSIISIALCFIFSLLGVIGFAQIQNDFLNKNISRIQLQENLAIKSTKFHSAIQPYEFLDEEFSSKEDSLFNQSCVNLAVNKKSEQHTFELEPIALFMTGYDVGNDFNSIYKESGLLGVKTQYNFKNKLHFRASIFTGKVSEERNVQHRHDIYKGIAELNFDDSFLDLANFNAALTYTPNDIFAFQIGKGKHKFGDGHQSLLLSDNAVNYPYAKIRTRIWDIEYINLFSAQKSAVRNYEPFLSSTGGYNYDFKRKFTSSHLLSWNINPDVNVYFFETIIWQHEDTLSQRGFDINYLNPIIFFRPVEFAVGSSDNAIVGAGSSWRVNEKFQIYGQFVIDEMVFKQFINQTGWWANKYGAQLGFKLFDPLKVKDSYFQLEWNQVRPFTYSHGSPQQNYAHYNQPLAHSSGSNFYEFLAIFIKDINRYQFTTYINFTLKGDDIPAFGEEEYQNLGGDIFQSYVNPFYVRGNVVGQGNTSNNLTGSFQAAYLFNEKSDGRIYLKWNVANVSYDHNSYFTNNLNIGLSMGFGAGAL